MEYFIKTLSKNVRHLPIKSWYAINWPPHFRVPLNVLLRPAQREGQLKYVHQATYNKNRQSSLWVPNGFTLLSILLDHLMDFWFIELFSLKYTIEKCDEIIYIYNIFKPVAVIDIYYFHNKQEICKLKVYASFSFFNMDKTEI